MVGSLDKDVAAFVTQDRGLCLAPLLACAHTLGCRLLADGKTHGVVLLNSNAMDVVLTKTRVSWRVTGGVLDFYFLMGPTPNAVMDQLTTLIGRPVMPPYWSLGLMNSKCGRFLNRRVMWMSMMLLPQF